MAAGVLVNPRPEVPRPRFTPQEMDVLLDEVSRLREELLGPVTTRNTQSSQRRAWEVVAFNMREVTGTERSGKEVKTKFIQMKYLARRRHSEALARRRAGLQAPPQSHRDARILAIAKSAAETIHSVSRPFLPSSRQPPAATTIPSPVQPAPGNRDTATSPIRYSLPSTSSQNTEGRSGIGSTRQPSSPASVPSNVKGGSGVPNEHDMLATLQEAQAKILLELKSISSSMKSMVEYQEKLLLMQARE